MPANTYTLIEKIVVGSAGASSVTFTSIPQTYTDLKIVASVRSNRTGAINSFMRLYPNGNSTGITYRALFGTGSAASSFTESTASQYVGEINATDSTSNTFSNTEIYIPNYTSGAQKSYSIDFVIENNATLAYMGLIGELWANTSAITSIQLLDGLANFVQNSTFYLYGVAKEGVTPSPSSAPYATGGDRIVFDGTYWYHAFTSSGTFTPRKNINCDYLVVAGGGGSGYDYAGGGGAGGFRANTAQSFANGTAYTITVGGGGAGSGSGAGSKGSNSSISGSGFTTFTSTGGGASMYGGSGQIGGTTGGSGGGASAQGTGKAGNEGGYTPVEGYAGGNGGASNGSGGGGGGATAAGSNGSSGTSAVGGAGGAGSSSYSSWGSATSTGQNVSGTYWYAGGGGGASGINTTTQASGGNGGGGTGGAGNASPVATSGTANTGGGGGGGAPANGSGGSGGSGLVIVRYAA